MYTKRDKISSRLELKYSIESRWFKIKQWFKGGVA